MAAARELYEETGIDLASSRSTSGRAIGIGRLKPAALRRRSGNEMATEVELCSLKKRCYFHLLLVDDDFPKVRFCYLPCERVREVEMYVEVKV